MQPRVWSTVLGVLILALALTSSRALGDHHIPAGAPLNIRTLQTLDTNSAWPGMRVQAVVDDPVNLRGRIILPRGAPARLEVVDVTPSSIMEGPAHITLRVLWLESRDRVSWVDSNEVQFTGILGGPGIGQTHLRVPAEARMQFQLNTCVQIE
jgi:hypothetical protein